MGVDDRRWVVLAALTILGMVGALATAGEAMHEHGDRAGSWGAVVVLVAVALVCLHRAVRVYRGRG